MRKIAISLSKGGVGKSTSAVNLSYCLAQQGEKVLLIDTDTSAQCSKLLGVTPDTGLAELMDGKDISPTEVRPNLWLLAGGIALSGTKRLIARREIRSEAALSEALKHLNQYDFVILDTSPGWDSLSINTLFFADEILCPVSLETLAVDGLISFLRSVEPIQEYKKIPINYILPTALDRRTKQSTEIMEQLIDTFKGRVCNPIRYSVKLSEAPAFGKTIFEYAPKDRGAVDYAKLAGRILRDGKKENT